MTGVSDDECPAHQNLMSQLEMSACIFLPCIFHTYIIRLRCRSCKGFAIISQRRST
jgi:hypothetical protein